MRIEQEFENIKEFACLSPKDKDLVLEEYRKARHPYQIEYQIWSIIIPAILVGTAERVWLKKMGLSNFELFGLLIIGTVIFSLACRFLVYNLIAPKVVKKIIGNLDELKKLSNNTLQQTAFRRR
jgi:hypothetical protein